MDLPAFPAGVVTALYARSHTLTGLLIRNKDDGVPRRWSHVGVLVPNRQTLMLEVIEARFIGGVQVTPVHAFLRRYRTVEPVHYEVPDYQAAMRQARHLVGTRYAWETVAGRAVGLHIDSPGVQCMEYLERVLQAGGLQRWVTGLHGISPNQGFNNACGRHVVPAEAGVAAVH